jgi:diaminohydroxyphosphoribosylaminopyrimidine deaminase/5-amino-6-(5-phosphoribosylamino)uracil reductase
MAASDQDEKFMQEALKLARRGIGSVEPNPAVGAVIVKAGRIIGKGRHKKFGGPHAEIHALQDCRAHGMDPRGAVMYVTLEPCCHYAKTPPCTEAIIAAGIVTVVVAMVDPSPHANGAGLRQLRDAGIQVRAGVCESEAKLVNAPFIRYATTGKCWVILKWAQTVDGKLAYAEKADKRRWISNELSRKDAHKLRRRCQGILVGVNTVIADNPLLTARPSRGKKPARIVLDTHLRIPMDCELLHTAKKVPVLVATTDGAVQANLEKADLITTKGAEILTVPGRQGRCDIAALCNELSRRGIAQLLVEGGPTVIASFLKAGLVDEVCVYIAPKILGSQGSSGVSEAIAELVKAIDLHHVDIKRFGGDVRISGLTRVPG